MTVKEARTHLFGPADNLHVEVHYNGESYDVTEESPAQAAFDKFIVLAISAPQPFHYCISLKQKYLVEGDGMSEKAKTIDMIADMLQQANARELDLVWRILRGMLGEGASV